MNSIKPLAAVSCTLLLAGVPLATPALAQIQAASQTVAAGSAPRLINLPRGSSFAVDLPADARDVIVSNPAVAEANVHSPRRITVIGIAPGETDAVFLDAAGRSILTLRVRVDAGVSALQDTLSRVAPGSQVRAEAVNDSIILTGVVSSAAESERIAQVARAFVSAPEKVLNLTTIAAADQVTVRVRIVEVQRNVIKQLGLSSDVVFNNGLSSFGLGRENTYSVNGSSLGGSGACYNENRGITTSNSSETTDTTTTLTGALESVVETVVSSAYNVVNGTNASACLQAFERVGLVRLLAEPNLTSVNGESASFLAGGEYPVPVGRDRDGNVTIEFKPYGVSLAFRPVVLSEGRINLQISAEVSELTQTGGITLDSGDSDTLAIAGLNVRRVQNTVEMPSGGSMMIAGLLQDNTRQAVDSYPGLASLPVLGSLFRSRDYLSGETELVVIVEPFIVNPTSRDQMQTPADGLRIASDLQTVFLGQLNQAYGTPAPGAVGTPGWQGPIGYVIE